MRILYTILIVIHITPFAHSQLNVEWVKSYNGNLSNNDEALAHVTDDSGNVYVTGKIINSGSNIDIYTVKYNRSGMLMWEKTYNGPANGSDIGNSIDADNDGNVYIAGETKITSSDINIVIIKYGINGEELWTRIYGGSGGSVDRPVRLITDKVSNIVVAGTTWQKTSTLDFVTLKFYSDGTQLWNKTYDAGNVNDIAADMAVDENGNVYVTGSSFGTGTQNDYLTVKYNATGEELWTRRYDGPWHANDNFTKIAIDGSGNPVVAGSSVDSGSNSDYLVVKYDPSGTTLWTSRYATSSPSAIDEMKAVAIDSDDNVIVTGASANSTSSYDYLTVKISSAGTFQWAKRYNGISNFNFDEARSVTVDDAGNSYVAGLSAGQNSLDDMIIVKYDQYGNELWVTRYNSPANKTDVANNISIDASGELVVSGIITGATTSADFSTIKFSALTGLNNMAGEIPADFSLSQNYPNPFNPVTKIKFSLLNEGPTELAVYDMLGKKISSLVDQNLKPGNYEVTFEGTALQSGVYFYRIRSGNFFDTKRMVLIK